MITTYHANVLCSCEICGYLYVIFSCENMCEVMRKQHSYPQNASKHYEDDIFAHSMMLCLVVTMMRHPYCFDLLMRTHVDRTIHVVRHRILHPFPNHLIRKLQVQDYATCSTSTREEDTHNFDLYTHFLPKTLS